MDSGTFNILMYSHDTYGLGHIRRTMAIARHLVSKKVNILIVTGSPIVGRFSFPEGVDFVRVPGMIKKSNTVYVPHSIKVDPKKAISIRKKIITATAKAFDPDLFVVDKVPVGLKGEVLPILRWFRKCRPDTEIVLGLRDILDDPESTRAEWKKKKYYEVLRDLYSEVWVYGEQGMYDPVTEYAFPEDVAAKCRFTGYIPRRVPKMRAPRRKEKLVVVTIGGGGDGYPVLDNYMRMLEQNGSIGFRTLMITGPFLPADRLDALADRARHLNVRIVPFVKNIEKKMASADLVIGMCGYNTMCEILSLKKPALVIPRDTPRREQLIRAEVFKKHGLIDFLQWDKVTPELMREKVDAMLADPGPYIDAMKAFDMTGLTTMRARLEQFMERRDLREEGSAEDENA
ncbi:glycosyltransferase family protein [Salidesulfovibrio brasiliensis]|uniref:glycosyltransferase family protein n=1 Tax=Salidesulfovibrio brasiliensis TaxID=221711 RepID=UPI0006CF87DF|nr:glycosyltransferase [Salidesulfovibrio brasiliensis]